MIYYPLTTLILAEIKNITIVSTGESIKSFQKLLGTGEPLGINLSYVVQDSALGISHGIEMACESAEINDDLLVILGDNIFYGVGMGRNLTEALNQNVAAIWTQEVEKPSDYGIAEFQDGNIISIEEKPRNPKSRNAVTGLYYFPNDLRSKLVSLEKSKRGEYEITSLLTRYLIDQRLRYNELGRGVYWLDAGTTENLYEAANFVRAVQQRQGLLIGSPEEASFRMGFISKPEFMEIVESLPNSDYKELLKKSEF
jgi:glucose-1-phosphate thymidylyltransferase